jgi:hypothetical protein
MERTDGQNAPERQGAKRPDRRRAGNRELSVETHKVVRFKIIVNDDQILDTTDPGIAHAFIDRHDPASRLKVDTDALQVAWSFLRAVYSRGPEGAGSDEVAERLKVSVRGIGSKLRRVNRGLSQLGYDQKDVYYHARVQGKGSRWRPRAKFLVAYEAVKRSVRT